jgi:hypothetical protein
MSQRDHYPPGVPCWVDTLTSDLPAVTRFYEGIFGWEFAGPGATPGDPPGQYIVARLHGHDVAGVGTAPVGGAPVPPAWNTQVAVASADETAAQAQSAGGSILVEPFDAPPAGRMAVLADPSGAVICVWEAGTRSGAARVNEPGAWAMSLLSTDDPDTAQAFYGDLFGWQAELMDAGSGPQIWLWRLPGYFGGEPQQPVPRDVVAAMTSGTEGAQPNWSVDFWVSDADSAAAQAAELGGHVVVPPAETAGFNRTVLADPGGAAFSASQLLLPH